MRMRTSAERFRMALLAAMGALPATACGGVTRADGDTNSGGAGDVGGAWSSGGASAGGSSNGGFPSVGPWSGGAPVAPKVDEARFTTCAGPVPDPNGGGFEHCNSGVLHRHAALGFRFLKWALDSLSREERTVIEARMDEVLAGKAHPLGAAGVTEAQDEVLTGHGLLPAEALQRMRTAALREVVAPCVAALRMCFRGTHRTSVPAQHGCSRTT